MEFLGFNFLLKSLILKFPTLPPENVEDGGGGGECADFALRGKHVVGRALWARTYALLSKRLLFLNIFIGFSAEIVILQ